MQHQQLVDPNDRTRKEINKILENLKSRSVTRMNGETRSGGFVSGFNKE